MNKDGTNFPLTISGKFSFLNCLKYANDFWSSNSEKIILLVYCGKSGGKSFDLDYYYFY